MPLVCMRGAKDKRDTRETKEKLAKRQKRQLNGGYKRKREEL